MKKLIFSTALILITALVTSSYLGAQTQVAQFKIEIEATGKIDLKCSQGCSFKELSWTCGDTNSKQQCTVTVDESGMLSQ